MKQFLCFHVVLLLILYWTGTFTKADNEKIEIDDTDSPSKYSLNVSYSENTSKNFSINETHTITSETTLKTTRSTKKPSKKSNPNEKTTIKASKRNSTKSSKNDSKPQFECPKDNEAPFQLFYTSCNSNKECKGLGPTQLCCKLFGSKRCIEGKVVQPVEPKHEPILFVIPRRCPKPGQILAETWWNIQTCENDSDCWPRICCPDGKLKYCKTSQPEFESASIPAARQLATPLESVSQYLQCTPPPPPVFDPHPKSCNNTLDCFPNLCCAEAGKKHCRPPKRSILSLLTGFAQGFSNVSFIRDWTENLVIK